MQIEVIQRYKIITFASASLIIAGTGISSSTLSLMDLTALPSQRTTLP